jgi:hypothetical protein
MTALHFRKTDPIQFLAHGFRVKSNTGWQKKGRLVVPAGPRERLGHSDS